MTSIAELRRLYESGMSLRQIENETGTPRVTVKDRLVAAGVRMRGRGGNQRPRLSHSEFARVAFMYERLGLSTNEIAEELGIARQTVRWRLSQHGVAVRSRGESTRMRFERRPRAA